ILQIAIMPFVYKKRLLFIYIPPYFCCKGRLLAALYFFYKEILNNCSIPLFRLSAKFSLADFSERVSHNKIVERTSSFPPSLFVTHSVTSIQSISGSKGWL